MRCFLSDLVIPKGKESREHLVPKHFLPPKIYSLQENIVPAIKIINSIKSDLFPCQWETVKYDRLFYALVNYNLRNDDKSIVRQVLNNGLPERNPCNYCICTQYKRFCIKRMKDEQKNR